VRALAALLALLVAVPARAAEPCDIYVIEVEQATVLTPKRATITVRGGAYLLEETHVCVVKRLAAAEAEVRALREAPVVKPAALIVAVSVAFSLGAGLALMAR
jgi:hypothetical protein